MQKQINNIYDIPYQYKKYFNLPLLTQTKTIEYIKKAQNQDKTAKEILIKHNLKLIYSIILPKIKNIQIYMQNSSHQNIQEKIDEIFEAGILGLNIAIEKFDTESYSVFTTYATYWIECEIKKEIKKIIFIHLSDDKYIATTRIIIKALKIQKQNPMLSLSKIIKKMNLKYEEQIACQAILEHPKSFQELYNEKYEHLQPILGRPITLEETIPSPIDIEFEIDKMLLKNAFEKIFSSGLLTQTEIIILKLKYGFLTKPMSNIKIVDYLKKNNYANITHQRVSQIIQLAIKKIRLSQYGLELTDYLDIEEQNKAKIELIKEQREANVKTKQKRFFKKINGD